MSNFKCLLKKDLTSIFRTKKFLIILLVLIGFAIISPISAKILAELIKILGDEMGDLTTLLGSATYIDSYVQLNGNLAEMFIFILIIMFAGSIIKEKTKGTYFVLKTNGVKKQEFILSHILSQIIAVTVTYIISLVFFILTTLILFGEALPKNFLYSLFSLYLFMIFFVVLINFISGFSKSNTQSMVLNFSLYFGILILNIFTKIKYFFPFSLTDNVISVLNGKITTNTNISILTTIVWCIIMIVLLLLFSKDKINNKKGY